MMKGKFSHSTFHILYNGVRFMRRDVLLLCVKAGKTGREGSETLPEIQAALVSQLCLHFTYRHFALGHVGNIHVMAAGLNQKKKAHGVVTSCLLEVYK